jgi:hypothetical protein
MPFESISKYITEIESRLVKRQSPLKIARDLGLSKSIVYQYKKERFDVQGAAAVDWDEEQEKSHDQRLAEGKAPIIDSLELLNKAKSRAQYLLDLDLGSAYTTAEGETKALSLASAAIYWQAGQKMTCEIIKQELELIGDDPESRKAEALESWADTRLAILGAVDNDPEAKAAIIAALEQRRRPPVCPGPGNLVEGGPGIPSRPMAAGSPPEPGK